MGFCCLASCLPFIQPLNYYVSFMALKQNKNCVFIDNRPTDRPQEVVPFSQPKWLMLTTLTTASYHSLHLLHFIKVELFFRMTPTSHVGKASRSLKNKAPFLWESRHTCIVSKPVPINFGLCWKHKLLVPFLGPGR